MATVNVHEAKTNLSRLLEDVLSGREVVISRRGVPVARLCPLEGPARRVPGLLSGTVGDAFFEPLPDEELAGWEG